MNDVARVRPHALLVTRNLPPLRGGMERLIHHLALALSATHELTVIGPKGSAPLLPQGIQALEVPHQPLPRFLFSCGKAVLRQATGRTVSLVVAGSGLAAPFAWLAARRMGARFAVYLHGLDIVAPSLIYQLLWLPFIRSADVVLVNSGNTGRLAEERGVPSGVIRLLHPGTDLPGRQPETAQQFRHLLGLGDRPLMLSVGRLTRRKGLAEFILHALPAVLARHPDALLLVIGADANDAVHQMAGSERERILDFAHQAGVSEAVRILPHCDESTLSAAYQAADTHVFPVVDVPGDVEGFGMVAIEAAARGAPTVGFGVGGVPDAIVEGVTGSLADPSDYETFAAQVCYWLENGRTDGVRERCASAAVAFGWSRFEQRLHAILAQ